MAITPDHTTILEYAEIFVTRVLIPVAGVFLTWLITKKKYDAKVQSVTIDNDKQSIELAKNIVSFSNEQMLKLIESHNKLEGKVESLENRLNEFGCKNAPICLTRLKV